MPSRFERDLADLHGLRAPPRPVFEAEVMVRRQPMSQGRERALRALVGILGLFWAIVLGLVVLAMMVAFGCLLWGAFS